MSCIHSWILGFASTFWQTSWIFGRFFKIVVGIPSKVPEESHHINLQMAISSSPIEPPFIQTQLGFIFFSRISNLRPNSPSDSAFLFLIFSWLLSIRPVTALAVVETKTVISVAKSNTWSICAASQSLLLGYKPDNLPHYRAIAPVWAIGCPSTIKHGNWWCGISVPSSNLPAALTRWNSSDKTTVLSNSIPERKRAIRDISARQKGKLR